MIRILSTFDKKTPPIIISYIDSGRSISTYCEVFEMEKYTDARYPEKINDLIDNEGGLSEEGKTTINESVKEAIEGGDIPVPAGGTKLYKHSLSINNVECIKVISSKSTSYTRPPEFGSEDAISILFYAHSSWQKAIGSQTSSTNITYYFLSGSSISSAQFSVNITDTVTEL